LNIKLLIILYYHLLDILYLFFRYRNQLIRHDRLVEDSQVDSFYRITFPDNKDEPNIHSGIENPSYNELNQK